MSLHYFSLMCLNHVRALITHCSSFNTSTLTRPAINNQFETTTVAMEPAPRSGITINDSSIDRPCWDQYKDGDGILRIGGVVIKPSGSVRIGEVKIYPSGLIEVGKNIQIDGAVGAVDPVAGSNSAELADSNAVRCQSLDLVNFC